MFGIIALASVASAYNASVPQDNATVTEHPTVYTTYCPEPTTFTRANMTYTVTEPTTLTITDCGTKQCETPQKTASASSARNATNGTSTKSPEHTGAGSSLKVGAAAAVVGAVAYLL